ncbi:hypothetical protein Tco_0486920 [Tanacetum coccineum]
MKRTGSDTRSKKQRKDGKVWVHVSVLWADITRVLSLNVDIKIHGKGKKRVEQVTDIIVDTVKLKLAYVKFKKSARVDNLRLTWKISNRKANGGSQ